MRQSPAIAILLIACTICWWNVGCVGQASAAADFAAAMVGAWIASGAIGDLSQVDRANLKAAIAERINDQVNDYGAGSRDTVEWARLDLLDNDGLNLTQVLCAIPDLSFLSRDPLLAMAALRRNAEFQALLSEKVSTSDDPDVTSSSGAYETVEGLPSTVDLTLPVLAGLVLLAVSLLWCRDHLF